MDGSCVLRRDESRRCFVWALLENAVSLFALLCAVTGSSADVTSVKESAGLVMARPNQVEVATNFQLSCCGGRAGAKERTLAVGNVAVTETVNANSSESISSVTYS